MRRHDAIDGGRDPGAAAVARRHLAGPLLARPRPASRRRWFAGWDRRFRFSACVSVTSASARPTAARSCGPARPMHGKTSRIHHRGTGIFYRTFPLHFSPLGYHSLVIAPASVPADAPGHGHVRGRRDHGGAARPAPGLRGAVPPRVGADRARLSTARPFPPRRSRQYRALYPRPPTASSVPKAARRARWRSTPPPVDLVR